MTKIHVADARMWQPRGSAPKGGDDVVAFGISFSPMA